MKKIYCTPSLNSSSKFAYAVPLAFFSAGTAAAAAAGLAVGAAVGGAVAANAMNKSSYDAIRGKNLKIIED